MIVGIVAIAKNFAIGRGGKLPWHYPADLKFFKETTTDHSVVMGANTWRAIGKPLPRRLNVVLTRSDDLVAPPEVMKLQSREEVIDLSRLLMKEVFIIGGAKTYAEFADHIRRWIVTEVPVTIDDADTFMPENFLDGFRLDETRDLGDGLQVKFLHRRRR
jgi:dihydrofolate reductase